MSKFLLVDYEALEKQLAVVGERWAYVCHTVEERSVLLQSLVPQWQQLEDEELCFSQWLNRKEQQLNAISEMPAIDNRALLEQVKLLQVTTIFIMFIVGM